jgi:non-histone chromosomal protein 6
MFGLSDEGSDEGKKSIMALLTDLKEKEDQDHKITRLTNEVSQFTLEEREQFKKLLGNGGNGGEKRNKRRRRNPNAPKGVKSAYLFFSLFFYQEMRNVKGNVPGMNHKDALKEISSIWSSMSEEDREPYIRLSNQDKLRYKKEMESRLTPADLERLLKRLKKDLAAIKNEFITPEIERKMDIELGNGPLKGNESIMLLPYHRVPEAMHTRGVETRVEMEQMEEAKIHVNQVLKELAQAAHSCNKVREMAQKMAQRECEGLTERFVNK